MNLYSVSNAQREYMALNIMFQIAKRFYQGQPQFTVEDLSRTLSIPARLVGEITQPLKNSGLLQETLAVEPALQPGQDLHLISVLKVYESIRNAGQNDWQIPEDKKNGDLEKLVKIKTATERDQWGQVTLLDLIKSSPP
jgi:DNA-binding IscR family transcriptional regulator